MIVFIKLIKWMLTVPTEPEHVIIQFLSFFPEQLSRNKQQLYINLYTPFQEKHPFWYKMFSIMPIGKLKSMNSDFDLMLCHSFSFTAVEYWLTNMYSTAFSHHKGECCCTSQIFVGAAYSSKQLNIKICVFKSLYPDL